MTGLPPATALRATRDVRMLVVNSTADHISDHRLTELPSLLSAGDLLVLNDAATLPASLPLRTETDTRLEIRLLEAPSEDGLAWGVLYDEGSWRTRTEDRRSSTRLAVGARLVVGDSGLLAEVIERSASSERLLLLLFRGTPEEILRAIYRVGRPIQYSYLAEELPLWAFQTPFATRPWAVEPPSAGLMLNFSLLASARERGQKLARLTHGAGLSSTGDPRIDERLPLSERYEIPEETVQAIRETKRQGGRVLAIGTTVLRALEGAWERGGGSLVAGAGRTALRIGPSSQLHVVDGLLTGMHRPGESHYEIMRALVPERLLDEAFEHATSNGYLAHELGDTCLVLG